jgi:hypothetical protein
MEKCAQLRQQSGRLKQCDIQKLQAATLGAGSGCIAFTPVSRRKKAEGWMISQDGGL